MRRIPSAVAIASTSYDRERRGLTATAVCSVSAEPPQLLACVNKQVRAHGHI
ncbi:flavin reductase family protein [uncultured Pigmentiphaga sp.]|uniref:flavin reductase family protein n=2 Tax=Pigmentiphaga TaxID=152267 RepID=UPI00261F4142|nr:flavin reductase family protein [uncultured Pigmentiphaga sp.]